MSDQTAPADAPRRSAFDRFAEAATEFVSSGAFFVVSVVVVALWIPTIFLFRSVDTWQLVINTATSVLAFLLVALLQNSERRYDRALHEKVDALATAVADLMEHASSRDQEELRDHAAELREAVKLEERM
jgi:low affinity Fe/Cu permease